MSSEVVLDVADSEAKIVEQETRNQQHSQICYRMRSGRVTASKLKAICCTDPCLPSHTLIMSISYHEVSKFSSAGDVSMKRKQ